MRVHMQSHDALDEPCLLLELQIRVQRQAATNAWALQGDAGGAGAHHGLVQGLQDPRWQATQRIWVRQPPHEQRVRRDGHRRHPQAVQRPEGWFPGE